MGAPTIKLKRLMKWGTCYLKPSHEKRGKGHILIMAGDMHARESRNDGSRKMNLQKAKACEGIKFWEFSLK